MRLQYQHRERLRQPTLPAQSAFALLTRRAGEVQKQLVHFRWLFDLRAVAALFDHGRPEECQRKMTTSQRL